MPSYTKSNKFLLKLLSFILALFAISSMSAPLFFKSVKMYRSNINIQCISKKLEKKEKLYLYEIVMKYFAFEEAIKKAQQNVDELKSLEEQFKVKK